MKQDEDKTRENGAVPATSRRRLQRVVESLARELTTATGEIRKDVAQSLQSRSIHFASDGTILTTTPRGVLRSLDVESALSDLLTI